MERILSEYRLSEMGPQENYCLNYVLDEDMEMMCTITLDCSKIALGETSKETIEGIIEMINEKKII